MGLWYEDFSGTGDSVAQWNPNNQKGAANRSYVTSGLPGQTGRALKLFASKNNDGYTGYGTQARVGFPRLGLNYCNEATLSYDLLLPKTWNPYAGGKLPGLGGRENPSLMPGGAGKVLEGEWFGRLMWLKASDGNLEHARLTSYLYVHYAGGKYLADNVNKNNGLVYGIQVIAKKNGVPVYLSRGRKHAIKIRYVMNTPGSNNGIFQAYLNGDLVINLNDVVYRQAGEKMNLTALMFDSFYGGPTSNKTDQYWGFDNAKIATV